MALRRRKIRFNVWRDPTPKPVDYLSPHCAHDNCKWCSGRRKRAAMARTAALQAATAHGMFWTSLIDRGQPQLGPGAWIQTQMEIR